MQTGKMYTWLRWLRIGRGSIPPRPVVTRIRKSARILQSPSRDRRSMFLRMLLLFRCPKNDNRVNQSSVRGRRNSMPYAPHTRSLVLKQTWGPDFDSQCNSLYPVSRHKYSLQIIRDNEVDRRCNNKTKFVKISSSVSVGIQI